MGTSNMDLIRMQDETIGYYQKVCELYRTELLKKCSATEIRWIDEQVQRIREENRK